MQAIRSRSMTSMRAAAWFGSAGTAVAALLILFPPDRYPFYPACPIATYLHLQCPGCGATRAFAALLHGHLSEALHLNALTTLLLPIAVVYYAWNLWRQRTLPTITLLQPPSYAIYTLLATAALFAFARNLTPLN
ncbi:hypothetical protein BH10ACI4_BH10ACI4_15610 [soil metagenome]